MKKILTPLMITTLLAGCGSDSNNDNAAPSTPKPTANILDMSKPTDVVKLGNGFTLDFAIESIAKGKNQNFNVDATVFSNQLLQKGNFAQVHGITKRNYKVHADATFSFKVTATTKDNKQYQLSNYNLYYENPTSTSVPQKLAIAKVENNPNNVNLWDRKNSVTINKDFISNNDGDKLDIAQERPMNLYVRVANVLSNGIQFVPGMASGSYKTVQKSDCSKITTASTELQSAGIAQQTCVDSHGSKLPILIEDKTQQNSEAKVAHVRSILKFYLDNMPKEITQTMVATKATMAFFYDKEWSNRPVAGNLEENYRFQDLFATETTTVTTSEDKPDLDKQRDAAFEEIIHLVHDYGIMAYAVAHPTSKWAQLQKELDELTEKAIRSGNYFPNGKDATITEAELDAESYDQEYLAYSLYAYYDLNHKGYKASELKSATYNELKQNDPAMVAFMDKYFPARSKLKAAFPGYPNN